MLKYSYSLSVSSSSQDINLDDLYISPDLTFISGTTTNTHVCTAGDKLWVRSPYFPNDQLTKVANSEIVKRNGFVKVPKKLPLQKAKTYVFSDSGTTVYYVEYNGNTYFAGSSGNTFSINGENYVIENNSIAIGDKIYIENDKLTVNGIVFNAFVDNNNQLYLTDFVGNNYVIPETWNCSGVTSTSQYVLKLSIGENVRNIIDCNSVTYYGHRAYIVYQNQNKYLEYFYDNEGNISGAGVKIDGAEYSCDALFVMSDSDWELGYNLYDINSYYTNENDKAVMTVEGNEYIIYFEPDEMYGTGIIGIETVMLNPPILKGDRITIHNVGMSTNIVVRYDVSGSTENGFVYIDGRRHNSIKNLCDSVVLGDSEYMLTYDGDSENPTSDTILSTDTGDGNILYFKFDSNGNVLDTDKVRRVEYVDGQWRYCYTMIDTVSGVTYSNEVRYQVNHADGFMIGDYKAKIYHYEYKRDDTMPGETDPDENGLIVEQYDYIVLDSTLGYRLKVISTVGNNRLLCIPDVDITTYTNFSREQLTDEILYSIQGNTFVVEKRNNCFGTTDLYYDTWMAQAAQLEEPSSVYEIADVRNSIHLIKKRSHFTIPIGLSKRVSINMEYENLITSQYYDEEAEIAINPLVDMEKDMYSPVIKVNESNFEGLDEIVFNLHFRTRDLETWKVIEDEGSYIVNSGTTQVLTANYQYCNWFVTDYYPFYQYVRNNDVFSGQDFGKVITRSDLLGFLFFTTDDVKSSRDKLEKSFLRLTFFDSRNPEKQNMLGTSTIYFDCDRYLNLLNEENDTYHYEECLATRNSNRGIACSTTYQYKTETDNQENDTMCTTYNIPTVLKQAFEIDKDDIMGESGIMSGATKHLYIGDDNVVLDSRITVRGRNSESNISSEGFDTYIIKAFADKKKPQTIYMKAEFFHAGVGIKIPMVLATSKDGENYNAISEWNSVKYNDFLKGYDLNTVFERLYIPITIEYSKTLRKFVYYVSEENNYLGSVLDNGKRRWMFNLFELKIKPNEN